jgi:hypothetical protein
LKKNKLVLEVDYEHNPDYLTYKVRDAHKLYLITRDRSLAERIYKEFKEQYQEEKRNASKV